MDLNECREIALSVPYRSEVSLLDRLYNWPYFESRSVGFVPPLEIVENDKEFKVLVELPGVERSSLSTSVSSGELVIKGEKRRSSQNSEDLCCCSERGFGTFERIVPVDSSVDTGKVQARFDNGILEVTLPKLEAAKPKEVKIAVK